jgi:imidazole glycerol phosphate synthase subunit HisF
MTLFTQGKPSRRKSVWGHNTGTTTEDVYVCPANCVAEVNFIHIHNSTGNTNIDIEWYVAADTYTSHFLNDKSLAGGGYHEFPDIDLVLQAGDKIQVEPGAAGHIDSIVTVTETFVPVG